MSPSQSSVYEPSFLDCEQRDGYPHLNLVWEGGDWYRCAACNVRLVVMPYAK